MNEINFDKPLLKNGSVPYLPAVHMRRRSLGDIPADVVSVSQANLNTISHMSSGRIDNLPITS